MSANLREVAGDPNPPPHTRLLASLGTGHTLARRDPPQFDILADDILSRIQDTHLLTARADNLLRKLLRPECSGARARALSLAMIRDSS